MCFILKFFEKQEARIKTQESRRKNQDARIKTQEVNC